MWHWNRHVQNREAFCKINFEFMFLQVCQICNFEVFESCNNDPMYSLLKITEFKVHTCVCENLLCIPDTCPCNMLGCMKSLGSNPQFVCIWFRNIISRPVATLYVQVCQYIHHYTEGSVRRCKTETTASPAWNPILTSEKRVMTFPMPLLKLNE